jgi:hypothetical protein
MNQPLPLAARYCPYSELGDQPNIIVDGSAQRATELTLSHWPWSPTAPELLRDTSTDIVFAYLDSPAKHRNIELVSNSHFDEDGLLSMYALIDSENALRHRDLMIGASRVGDFSIYTNPEAAKLAFILGAYADPEASPLTTDAFSGSPAQQVASLYRQMLAALPALLTGIPAHEELWRPELEHLHASEAAINAGEVVIDAVPELDLAIVHIPEHMPARIVRRYLRNWQRSVHPMAVHNVTQASRLIWLKGQSLEFQYRYESWVKLASRRPALRIDLSGLVEKLCDLETAGGEWVFEGVNEVAPRLMINGSCQSSIPPDHFIGMLADWLTTEPAAWDPYNKPD